MHKKIQDIKTVFLSFLENLKKIYVEEISNAELSEHLNYKKHDQKSRSKNTDGNYRNGSSKKLIKSNFGNIQLDIPRDSNASFYPSVIEKYKSALPDLEDQILGLYMCGMSDLNISSLLDEQYGITIGKDAISDISNKLLILLSEWKSRPLSKYFPITFIDGFRVKVREENTFVEKVCI